MTLGLIGAAAAAPLMRAPSARAELLDLDPSNPLHTLMITRKLAHAMDDSIVFWWAQLSRMGMVDKIATPLWNVHVGALLKTRDIDETTTISMVFYTDIETGEYLRTFKNPYTGQQVEVNYFPARPAKGIVSIDESASERPARPGFKRTIIHPLGPALIENDDVWVRNDSIFRTEPLTPQAGLPFRGNDWSTYHGSVTDVANAEIKNAPATWHFNDILSWPPWLGMGDRPGDFVSRGFGRKVSSFHSMPQRLQELIEDRHPDIYKDPAAALRDTTPGFGQM